MLAPAALVQKLPFLFQAAEGALQIVFGHIAFGKGVHQAVHTAVDLRQLFGVFVPGRFPILCGALLQQLFNPLLCRLLQFGQVHTDRGITAGHIVPSAAAKVAASLCGAHLDAVAAFCALQQTRQPCMGALAAVAHLAVTVQLLLTAQPQRRRNKPHTVEDEGAVMARLCVPAVIGAAFTHQQYAVNAVKGARLRCDLYPF